MTQEGIYNLIFGVLFILLGKVGDYLDEQPPHYSCPPYCAVDHIHLPILKETENDSINKYNIMDSDSLFSISNIH